MQQFFDLHPWKQWKVAILYHLLLLLGKPKHEFFRVQLFLQSQFIVPVSSTALAETIYGCFMARRQTCKAQDTNLSMSWSGSFWATDIFVTMTNRNVS